MSLIIPVFPYFYQRMKGELLVLQIFTQNPCWFSETKPFDESFASPFPNNFFQ